MAGWLMLSGAIVAEVFATVALKVSDGFSRFVPSGLVVVGYLVSFYLLARILARGMNLGVVYAVWSAVGVALIVLVDILFFGERLRPLQVGGLLLVVLGVAALELGGTTA
ncbi:DMT family transporter [Segeticoccus rhizosphaerae]|uniref:DMT family transporter n=1 Tax=Segeticoccus rhizosphaerae TaxID=1104777 RepID=UPI00193ADD4F|nr:multidrug efflux SMR transporter [Segeticoccus rhizosphaerae]